MEKVTAKNLLNDCMEKIDEAMESHGDRERTAFPGPYDKISLYLQVFGVKPQSAQKNTKDEKARRGTIMHGAAAEEEEEDMGMSDELMSWMQHADEDMAMNSMHKAKSLKSVQAAQFQPEEKAGGFKAFVQFEGY